MTFKLESTIYNLLQTEPFYAHLILGCKVQYNLAAVPTAGVCIQNNEICLCINTEFMGTLTPIEQSAILKHELMHLLLEHCGARKGERLNAQIANIAMDCAINQFIHDLPSGGITLEGLEKILKVPLLPEQPYEYYFQHFKNSPHIKKVSVPNHDFMNGSDDDAAAAELGKILVKDAAEKALKSSAGNVPREIHKLLPGLLAAAKIPWATNLRNLVASSRSVERKSSRSKADRRYGFEVPGKKKIRKLRLAVCADSSGSVSDEAFAAFINEIVLIAKQTTSTWLIDADCSVQSVLELKDGVVPEKARRRNGSGGTAYQPAITAAMTKSVDAIIYFGDMDSADVPVNPGIPFIWVVVGNSKPPGNFGHTIKLDI